MSAIDESCLMPGAFIFVQHTPTEYIIDEEYHKIWVVQDYQKNRVSKNTVSMFNRRRLPGYVRDRIADWRRQQQNFDAFVFHQTETRAFDMIQAREMFPALILSRRVFFPHDQNDHLIAAEAFGKVVGVDEIARIMCEREESDVSLACIAVHRFAIGYRKLGMMFLRLWTHNKGVYFREDEYLRECLECAVKFNGHDRSIRVTVKVGLCFNDVTLIYRNEPTHVENFTTLIQMETRYGGVVLEFGHVISWFLHNDWTNEGALVQARALRFGHRVLRNTILEIADDDSERHRDVLLHSLRAVPPGTLPYNVAYRLLDIYRSFDSNQLTDYVHTYHGNTSYDSFILWIESLLSVPSHFHSAYHTAASSLFLEL